MMSNDVSVNVLFFSYQMSTIKRLQFNPTPSDSKKAPFLCELWPIIFDCFTAAARLVMCQVLTRKEDFWFLEILNIYFSPNFSVFSDSLAHKKKIE